MEGEILSMGLFSRRGNVFCLYSQVLGCSPTKNTLFFPRYNFSSVDLTLPQWSVRNPEEGRRGLFLLFIF